MEIKLLAFKTSSLSFLELMGHRLRFLHFRNIVEAPY